MDRKQDWDNVNSLGVWLETWPRHTCGQTSWQDGQRFRRTLHVTQSSQRWWRSLASLKAAAFLNIKRSWFCCSKRRPPPNEQDIHLTPYPKMCVPHFNFCTTNKREAKFGLLTHQRFSLIPFFIHVTCLCCSSSFLWHLMSFCPLPSQNRSVQHSFMFEKSSERRRHSRRSLNNTESYTEWMLGCGFQALHRSWGQTRLHISPAAPSCSGSNSLTGTGSYFEGLGVCDSFKWLWLRWRPNVKGLAKCNSFKRPLAACQ